MKTLVVPDVHQDIKSINKMLKEEPHVDEVVFLGDYFDSFYEPPLVSSFRETCRWLKEMVVKNPQKYVFLVGNHDVGLFYLNNKKGHSSTVLVREYYCSGMTKSKVSDFRKEFFDYGLRDDFFFNHFKLIHKSNGFLFSHAGLGIRDIPAHGVSVDNFIQNEIPEVFKSFRNFSHPRIGLLLDVGLCRGGNECAGGILWKDWREEFVASHDIGKQIVGHTTLRAPECIAEGTNYESWNIDTNRRHYAIITDGRVKIYENK